MVEWFGPRPGFIGDGKQINKNKVFAPNKIFEPSEEDKEFVMYLNNKYSGRDIVVHPDVYLYNFTSVDDYIICKIVDIEREDNVSMDPFKINLFNQYLGNAIVRSYMFYFPCDIGTTLFKRTDPYLVCAKKIDYLNGVIKYKFGIFKK